VSNSVTLAVRIWTKMWRELDSLQHARHHLTSFAHVCSRQPIVHPQLRDEEEEQAV
jgi:hypothetical protein